MKEGGKEESVTDLSRFFFERGFGEISENKFSNACTDDEMIESLFLIPCMEVL